MNRVVAGALDVAYEEVGPPTGRSVVLLHGFPYDVLAFREVAALLAADGRRCLVPYLRGFGPTRFLDESAPRSGEQAALGADLLAFMDALGLERPVLAGFDWGGRAACVVAALWPGRVAGLVSSGNGYNIQDIAGSGQPLSPEREHRFWYQHYLRTGRGANGFQRHTRDFCRLLWSLWSPTWRFDAATFEATAASFDNPDFTAIVVHSYRHRFGDVPGDPAYASIEERLIGLPPVTVPSLVIEGADDGCDTPELVDVDRPHFGGPYEKRVIAGAGHDLPQEAPAAYARAIADLG